MRARYVSSVSSLTALGRNRSGVQSSWISSTHDAPAGDQVDHAYMSTFATAVPSRYVAATACRARPSACRAAPSAPSPCPTPSPPRHTHSAHRRSARRRCDSVTPLSAERLEQPVVEVRRARDTNCTSGTCAAIAGAASRSPGADARSSFVRLPGSSASTALGGIEIQLLQERLARHARPREIDQRMADEPHVDARVAGRSPLRTERSAARDRRCASSA